MIRYCKKCVMPSTRPGLKFDKEGVCYACRAHEKLQKTDWDKRLNELIALADKYRGSNGNYYDCIIAVSAGKDSYYQVHIFKEVLGMNPLLVNVNNFSWTETGKHNWNNLLSEFGVDALQMNLNPKVCKEMFRKGLEMDGIPMWYFDLAIYATPYKLSTQLGIPLVIYGEDTNYLYGGKHSEESPSALKQITNEVSKPIPWYKWIDKVKTEGEGVCMSDFNPSIYPTKKEMRKAKFNPQFLSYYVPWSGHNNMEQARSRGFKTLDDTKEWKRAGFLEQYDQIDTIGYLVHCWFKFPKFGHFRVSEVASLWIREGRMTREEAVKKVLAEDWKLDRKMLKDFLEYIDYDEKDFWKIVDRLANKEMLEKKGKHWRLKPEAVKALKNGGVI